MNEYINRKLSISNILEKKSCFLFGPRQTGKTSIIRKNFNNFKTYNLLDSDDFFRFSSKPSILKEEIDQNDKIIIIDEIQRLPILLNEVQILIDEKNINFLLTGSSARKLKRAGINMLGGRARVRHLHPFSFIELKERFILKNVLNTGLLPSVYFSDDPKDDLKSYVETYLKEEVVSEALVRNIPSFSRFLYIASLCNSQMINYNNISNDAKVPRSTVREYFQILKDTLIGYELPAWGKSKKRKAFQTSKFFLFDIGVAHALQGRKYITENTPEYGNAFETYIFHELKSYIDYKNDGTLNYWRSTSGFEVDFILNEEIAIEVKFKDTVSSRDLKGLNALKEENIFKRYIIISQEKRLRKIDFIEIMPWDMFLNKLWNNKIL